MSARPVSRVAAAGAAATAALGYALAGGPTIPVGQDAAAGQGDFTVTGEVDGLYPGAVATLDARVTNPWAAPIEVTSVDVSAGDAGPGCPGSALQFGGATAAVEVPGRSTATVPVEVRMDAGVGDACRGATWPLTFTAHAVGPDGTVSARSSSGGGDGDPAGSGADAQRGPARFAFTGAHVALLVAVALAMLVAGLAAVWLARRRRRSVAR